MEEKRKYKRLDLDVSIQLESIHEGELETANFSRVSVTNMSRAGIGFKSPQLLGIGTFYDTKIRIWTKESIQAVIQIVRRDELADGWYNYGCIFIGMTEKEASEVDIYELFHEEEY